jgi:3-oxoacyl-[acyl-carrier protein] reductase
MSADRPLPDLFDLTDRTAVVTGGTRGIGRAITRGFADLGADVVPISRSRNAVETAAADVRDRDRQTLVQPTDVTDSDAVDDLFDRIVDEFDGVDILVNNAGVNPGAAMGLPETLDDDAIDTTIAVNLRGSLTCVRAAAPHLDDGSAVVNVASVGGLVGLPRQHPYVASKHGLVGLTRSLALDWAPDVRVNALAPGYVSTDLTADLEANDQVLASVVDRTPLDRIADPIEIAGPAAFLASDLAGYVTGEVLAVDGGWTAR